MLTHKIYYGDCTRIMRKLIPESIDLVVTSPPYDNLRNYNGYLFDFETIAKELFRIVKHGGVIVWVVGDATIDGSETGTSFRQALYFKEIGFHLNDTMIYEKNGSPYPATKQSNRYTQIFEYMFILSKGKPKTVNLIADKKNRWEGLTSWGARTIRHVDGTLKRTGPFQVAHYSPRNNIWRYNTGFGHTSKDKQAFKHPATFPEDLVRDHILTWSNEGDLVLDPLAGGGTTLLAAERTGRNSIGIDISKEYCKLAYKRLRECTGQSKLTGEKSNVNFICK